MNVIPFVFAILLILSYSLAASFQGRLLSHRNQRAHLALRKAELSLLRQAQELQFKALPGDKVKKEKQKERAQTKTQRAAASVLLNAPCARLNLYPLITEGRDAHPAVYETAANILRTFYQHHFFKTEKQFEYKILDAILAGAKPKIRAKGLLALETIALNDSSLQPIFYAMLKGTKRYRLSEIGCPPLIDYWKIEKEPGKICLFHCHPDMLTVFFGSKTAPKLYQELHGEGKKTSMSIDAILEWATDPQLRFVDKKVWDLIDFGKPQHASLANQTLLIEEDGVSVRKTILKKPTTSKI